MANRTRPGGPMTPEELRAYNRAAQQRRREKTDNALARAYNRSVRRAGAWIRENQPELWEQWMAEELGRPSLTPFQAQCPHEHTVLTRPVYTSRCLDCGMFLGTVSMTDANVAE